MLKKENSLIWILLGALVLCLALGLLLDPDAQGKRQNGCGCDRRISRKPRRQHHADRHPLGEVVERDRDHKHR